MAHITLARRIVRIAYIIVFLALTLALLYLATLSMGSIENGPSLALGVEHVSTWDAFGVLFLAWVLCMLCAIPTLSE